MPGMPRQVPSIGSSAIRASVPLDFSIRAFNTDADCRSLRLFNAFSFSMSLLSSFASRNATANSIASKRCLSSSVSMVPSFGDGLCENSIVSPQGGAAIQREQFSLLLRLRASLSRFAINDRMHRVITSFTASSAHLWMSFVMQLSMNCSMPSFGIFFGSDR